jgi:four helix bundle protein
MKDFHKLKVWEKAHNLALKVYLATHDFPKDEIYGLTSQMRRSSASIPTNIAEGCGRNSKAETIHFFNVATGSSSELEYQLILAHDLHYLEDKLYIELSAQLIEVRQMLYAFSQKLKTDLK